MPIEMGRNLEHTTERHQRGFKVPMETGLLRILHESECEIRISFPGV